MKNIATTRRGFLRQSTAAVIGLPLLVQSKALGAADKQAPNKQMNVLFLVVDDLNTWLLSDPKRYTGTVIAPNICKLADSGVNFMRNYTASPKCSPSRTAVLSGVAPWKSGVYQNGQAVDESPALKGVPQLPKHFRNNGYYTASSGKVFHGYSKDGCWDEYIGHHRTAKPPNTPLNGWARTKSGRSTESDWGPTHLKEEEMSDTICADFAVKQLQKKHKKPFFIACGMFHPHFPWYVPQKYLDMYPLKNITIPKINRNDLDDVPELAKTLVNGKVDRKIQEHKQHKDAIQGYLASTTYADKQMGRVLDTLEKSPYKDNTIVVLWSDHGFHLGEKMHWQKGTLWEEATHCLLMFRVPGVTSPGGLCEQIVSLLDIYPTLAELCGLPDLNHLDGQTLMPLLRDPKTKRAEPVITAYDEHLTVRTAQYRYIRYRDGSEELYDRMKDPHEWTNISNNPKYAAVKKNLNAILPAQDKMAPSVRTKKKNKKK